MVSVALLLGSAALWGASRMTWTAANRDAGVRGLVLETKTGAEQASALVPLAILALAGVAGMVATGGWPRRVLGVLLALAGVAACWVAVDGLRWSGYPDGAPSAEIVTAHILAAAGGILVILGGLAGTRGAGRMPRLGARYAAPGAKRVAPDPDTELWEALSDGEDPTAGR
ncbi:Trp biosynthesis-associated membrane protein [Amycolatopsis anabasis]|uniref:Trp biosynthesis-associated membrane protein n=1 Tax=Amycolatopsis anabasis TaxID=1840409 RepID=UPI00131E12A9|nr:Trp biosynthesis-associated membrane protein [Amycolatopsis anabasis]